MKLLKEAGLELPEEETRVLFFSKNSNIIFIFVRAWDIPLIVERGGADAGITGYDFVIERDAQVGIPLSDLGFGRAKLVIAAPMKAKNLVSIYDIQPHHVIATPYPSITREFLNKKRIYAHVINIIGACEIMPFVGISNLIADITTSGLTLRENKLKVIEGGEILNTSACLINNTDLSKKKEKLLIDLIDSLKFSNK